jgi:hypothetical protein
LTLTDTVKLSDLELDEHLIMLVDATSENTSQVEPENGKTNEDKI